MAPLSVYLQARDRAVEFTLADVEGVEHTLSDMLETKPVLLVIGSYTCPVYQEALPKLNAMSAAAFGETTLGESVHFVHVYVPEAHPLGPDPAPHLGAVSEEEYSTLGQPRNYADRLVNARRLIPSIDPSHLMLVDDLAPRAYDNPIWSTYGSGAASAWLIGQDGVIAAAHVWLDTKTLEKSMRYLLSRGG